MRQQTGSKERPIYAALVLAGLLAIASVPVLAAPVTGLAIVCTDVAADGKELGACPSTRIIYRTPADTDLVRDCGTDATCWTAGDVWRKSSQLAVGTTTEVCASALEQNTAWVTVDPCTRWQINTKTMPTSTTGTIGLSWDPVLLCIDSTDGISKSCNDPAHPDWAVRGYRVYSGTSAGAMTLLQTTAASVTALTLPGYGNGIYYFAVQAFNADTKTPDGERSSPLRVEVAKPVVANASAKPAVSGGTRATVTYK